MITAYQSQIFREFGLGLFRSRRTGGRQFSGAQIEGVNR
jgi:hypothetical protein